MDHDLSGISGRDDDEVPKKVRRLASDSGSSLENSSFSLDDDPQQELLAAIREEGLVFYEFLKYISYQHCVQ